MDPVLRKSREDPCALPELLLDLTPFPKLIGFARGEDVAPLKHSDGHGPRRRVLARRDSSNEKPIAIYHAGPQLDSRLSQASLRLDPANDYDLETQYTSTDELEAKVITCVTNASSNHYIHDVWQSGMSLRPHADSICVCSWSAFLGTNPSGKASSTSNFISETCDSAFDTALEQHYMDDKTGRPPGSRIHASVLTKSLWHLGLGKSSVLFPLAKTGFFEPVLHSSCVSGISVDNISEVVARFLSLGNATIALRHYADYVYGSCTALAAEVSLARAVRSVLHAVEEHIVGRKLEYYTILTLEYVFEASRNAIFTMKDLVETTLETELHLYCANSLQQSKSSNIGLLEALYDFTSSFAEQGPLVTAICCGTLAIVAEPWLKAISRFTGLHFAHDEAAGRDRTNADEFSGLPRFFNHLHHILYHDIRQAMAYISGDSMGYLEVALERFGVVAPELTWCFDWDDVKTIEMRCEDYESCLIAAIRSTCNPDSVKVPVFDPDDIESYSASNISCSLGTNHNDYLSESISMLNGSLNDTRHNIQDAFKNRILGLLASDSTHVRSAATASALIPIGLTPSLTVSSLFRTQCNILSHVALYSILHTHDLKGHIQAYYAFSLFGSGFFTSRLEHVLFSHDLEPSERHGSRHRVGRITGLNLGDNGRIDWPPSSSQLHLALMGILSDCWIAESRSHQMMLSYSAQRSTKLSRQSTYVTSIPGDLSFSLRNMSAEDTSRMDDSYSLYALDFLRLSGSPSASIAHIVTQQSRDNYDRCFALLLRLLRVKFVVTDQIPRDLRLLDSLYSDIGRSGSTDDSTRTTDYLAILQRTQHAAHYLISTISSHFMLTAINRPMSTFKAYIDELCASVCSPVPNMSHNLSRAVPSIAFLAAEHERTTVAVAAGLFLGGSYERVESAMNKCFEDILLQSRCVRSHIARLSNSTEDEACDGHLDYEHEVPTPKEGYNTFILDVMTFANECKNLATQAQTILGNEADEGARSAAELLSRLDNDWIARI